MSIIPNQIKIQNILIDLQAQAIIDSYAKAFWKVTSSSEHKQIALDCLSLIVILENKIDTDISDTESILFINLCIKPGTRAQKQEILDVIFSHTKLHSKTKIFLENIMQNGHLIYLIHILSAYHQIWNQEHNSIPATITTAKPIDKHTLDIIEKELTNIQNHSVHLINHVKPKHIGGAILLIKGEMFDMSYVTQLSKLNKHLQNIHINIE